MLLRVAALRSRAALALPGPPLWFLPPPVQSLSAQTVTIVIREESNHRRRTGFDIASTENWREGGVSIGCPTTRWDGPAQPATTPTVSHAVHSILGRTRVVGMHVWLE
jgi:hypothetical protein